MTKSLRILVVVLLAAVGQARGEKPFFSTERPAEVIEAEAHVIAGATGITQNYVSRIAGMVKADSHPGFGTGAGGRVAFVMRDYLALRVGFDLVWGHNRSAMTMLDTENQETDNIYLRNSYLYARIPLVMSLRFNLGEQTKWIVDGGFYWAFGLAGKQKAEIYSTSVNSLGQLVTSKYDESWNYFDENSGLIHSVYAFDFGVHVGTGFVFRDHYTFGVMLDYGLKDAARTFGGLRSVSAHNIDWMCRVGYQF